MIPSTLVLARTATTELPPATTANLVPVLPIVIPDKKRITLNLSVRDARNFSYLLRDIQVFSGERGEALNTVRRKLSAQLQRCPAQPQQLTN